MSPLSYAVGASGILLIQFFLQITIYVAGRLEIQGTQSYLRPSLPCTFHFALQN